MHGNSIYVIKFYSAIAIIVSLCLPTIFKTLFSSECFRFTANQRGSYTDFPVYLLPPHKRSLPCSSAPPTGWAVTMLMNLYGHTIVTQSLEFASGFTLGVIRSPLDKRILTCISHHSTVQGISTAPQILCALPIRLSLTPLLAMVILDSMVLSFYCLTEHLFLVLNNIPLPGCTTVYQFT